LFPDIDSINKIKGNAIDIYTINVPLQGERPIDNFEKLRKFGYSFKRLYAVNDNVVSEFNLKTYPTTVVIRDSIVIYKGDFLKAFEFAKTYR
jgi:hypothetical protein